MQEQSTCISISIEHQAIRYQYLGTCGTCKSVPPLPTLYIRPLLFFPLKKQTDACRIRIYMYYYIQSYSRYSTVLVYILTYICTYHSMFGKGKSFHNPSFMSCINSCCLHSRNMPGKGELSLPTQVPDWWLIRGGGDCGLDVSVRVL